jgi:hypothetical protein
MELHIARCSANINGPECIEQKDQLADKIAFKEKEDAGFKLQNLGQFFTIITLVLIKTF